MVELAVIAVQAPLVMATVKNAIAARARANAVALLMAGLEEASSKGVLLQSEVSRLCSESQARLPGPGIIYRAASTIQFRFWDRF